MPIGKVWMPILRPRRCDVMPDAGPRDRWFVRFWASGEQSFPKSEIHCFGRRWTAVQNVTPIALYSAEKFDTLQTNTQKHKQ